MSSRRRRTTTTSSKSPSQTPPPPSAATFFTEKDEIDLLESLSTAAAPPPFLAGKFTESQIANKIRRLRQNYFKLARSESSIKTPHDRRIFEIGRKIWGKEKTIAPPTPRPPQAAEEDDSDNINWSDYPHLMRAVSGVFSGTMELYKEGLKGLGKDILKGLDEKWKALDMAEAAIHARKLDLCCKMFKSEGFNRNK